MNGDVCGQDLRDFTVQIRHPATDEIVGTGFVVSRDGKIVTCKHVVEAAGVNPGDAKGAEVGVKFSREYNGEEKKRRARIDAIFSQYDDDVVILKLIGDPPPLSESQIAILGNPKDSRRNPFQSYGYKSLDKYRGGYASGEIQGEIELPEKGKYQSEPLELKSNEIDSGMSGAAVLDIKRNLVVGIISETWDLPGSTKNLFTAWAVNCRVLMFDPIRLSIKDLQYPFLPAQQPKIDNIETVSALPAKLSLTLNSAPEPPKVWVGREDLMNVISADWYASEFHVVGLIGFGGEGKSSLARQWLNNLIVNYTKGTDQKKPIDGAFWWTFDEKRNVDEFFKAALLYISNGKTDLLREYPSPAARAHIIAAKLQNDSIIFVLDQLEVMQHQDGDKYGQMRSDVLLDFIGYIAAKRDIRSFCLITSRVPLCDLGKYTTTYTYHSISHLSPGNGRTLLRSLGVNGSDEKLDEVVADWNGHALTLTLLGSLLVKEYGGDVSHINEIPLPAANGPYDAINSLLKYYDEHLKNPERTFLSIFSAFRTPVKEFAFAHVFRLKMGADAFNAPLSELDDSGFEAILRHLEEYSLLRFDPQLQAYMAHPLIRAHYAEHLTGDSRAQTIHRCIKNYYLASAGDLSGRCCTIDDLAPFIEAVYHSCRSGDYEEGYKIYLDKIDKKQGVLLYQLGAYETDLALMLEFFEKRGSLQVPLIKDIRDKAYLTRSLGLCLMTVGRLKEALPMYESSCRISLEAEDLLSAGKSSQLLSELHIHFGNLTESKNHADEAMGLYLKTKDGWGECCSLDHEMWGVQNEAMGTPQLTVCCLGYKAWAIHLAGDTAGENLFDWNEIPGRDGEKLKGFLKQIFDADFAEAAKIEKIDGGETIRISTEEKFFFLKLNGEKAKVYLKTSGDRTCELTAKREDVKLNIYRGASEMFEEAEELARKNNPKMRYLRDLWGIYHADHLVAKGNIEYAKKITGDNMKYAQSKNITEIISQCHRVMGDIDAKSASESARGHYDEAIRIARNITHRAVLIEGLLARARWNTIHGDIKDAFSDLEEALSYVKTAGYRIYEADIRMALADAQRAAGKTSESMFTAKHAIWLSNEIGYYRVKEAAEEFLKKYGE